MRSRLGIKCNVLTIGQIARLGEWLTKHRAGFAVSRPHLKTAASLAEKDLGFRVTEWNLKHLRRSMGISWPPAARVIRAKIVSPTLDGIIKMKPDIAHATVVAADDRKLLFQMAVAIRDIAAAWGIDSQAARLAGDTGERILIAMRAAANNT